MPTMREIGRHVHQFGPKVTPENINNFGQKVLHTGCVMGRKISNSISKIENVANVVCTHDEGSFRGRPEFS